MNNGTTSIDSLPLSPQSGGDNIRMEMRENNVQIGNPAQALREERDNDPAIMQKNLNQLVTGIQQASAAGLTALPSRDIPQNQQHILQDTQIKPNYIPSPEEKMNDYIREHQTNEEIIRAQAQKQVKKASFDVIFDEVQGPFMIGILYFLFQLPVIQKQLCKILPTLYGKDGNPNLSGYIFTSAAFASAYYFLTKSMNFLER